MIDLDLFEDISASEEGKAKRRKQWTVWCYFYMIPDSNKYNINISKPHAKFKMYTTTFMAVSKYEALNSKCHIDTCSKKNSWDISQLM